MDFFSTVEHVTGQPIDLRDSSQNNNVAVEEELETLRSKVEQLSDEVGSFLLSRYPLLMQHLTQSEINYVARLISMPLRLPFCNLSRKSLLLCKRLPESLVKR